MVKIKSNYLFKSLFPKENHTKTGLEKILTLIICFSIFLTVIETEKNIYDSYKFILRKIDFFIVLIFSVEYLLRLFYCGKADKKYQGYKGKVKYILSPYAIIDLVAILPTLLQFLTANLFFLRIFRLIRMLRVMKLIKQSPPIKMFLEAIIKSRTQLLGSLVVTLFAIFVSSICMYMVESELQPEQFGSIPRAMWWSMATLTTVGYGDVFPITALGKIISSIVAILGIGIVALPAGIIAGNYKEILEKQEK